jgi:hypothetical protein
MNIQDITYQDYLEQYRRDFSRIAAKRPRGTTWDYENTIFTTWEVSHVAIMEKDLREETCATMLLGVIGFLSPNNIDQRLFDCE